MTAMWQPGQTVLDRYELVEQLGSGLGGETWEAMGPSGPVAVKLINDDHGRFDDLAREAVLLRQIRHDHIVGYREFADRPDEGCAILVTELVEGGDVAAWIGLEGPRTTEATAALGLQVVAALEALEEVRVLHRDLKPANVFVDLRDDGSVQLRVGDFGISRRTRDGSAETRDRSLTPDYAAPEQHAGGPLTRAADLYALGGLLVFLATGQHPTGPCELGHEGLDAMVARLRHPDPAQRPTLAQTREHLDAIAAGTRPKSNVAPVTTGSTLSPPTATTAADAPTARATASRWLGVVGVLGLLALLAVGPGIPGSYDPAPTSPVAATAPEREAKREQVPEPEPESEPESEPEPEPERAPAPERAAAPAPSSRSKPPAAPAPQPAAAGVLFVNSRPWSWVYVDGTKQGRTTDAGARFELPAGSHDVTLRTESGLEWSRSIDVSASTRVCVNLRTGTEFGC